MKRAASPKPEHVAALDAIAEMRTGWFADAIEVARAQLDAGCTTYSREVADLLRTTASGAATLPIRYRIELARRALRELEEAGVARSRLDVHTGPGKQRMARRVYELRDP